MIYNLLRTPRNIILKPWHMPCFKAGTLPMTSLNKTLSVLVTAIAALGFSQVASANTLVLNLGTYQSGSGGEFTASNSLSVPFGLHGYSAWTSTTVGTTITAFDTFCVQAGTDDVTFVPGSTYTYAYSGTIIGGALDPRTLNQGVAYLYGQFAAGTLSGYDYANTAHDRTAQAAALQSEIWFLEGEGGTDSAFYDGLITAANLSGTYTAGEFGVDVLNLWTANGAPVQNQLVFNNRGFTQTGHPIPDNGLTIAMIGISFLGLALYRRKSVKA
jgi:hypothetical protein